MNRILALPFVAAISLTACSSTPCRITNETLIAATPERMVVVSLRKSGARTKIIVLADQNQTFIVFRDQLENARVITAELNVLKSYRVCGRRVSLAEFDLNGDTSLLKEITSSGEQINQFLGVPTSKTECASEVLTENFADECTKRYSEQWRIDACLSHKANVDYTWTHPSKRFQDYVVDIKECRSTATSEPAVESCMIGKEWKQSR
jgi:hypothetical protein